MSNNVNRLNEVKSGNAPAISGSGMDRKVTVTTNPIKKWLSSVVIVFFIVGGAFLIFFKSS